MKPCNATTAAELAERTQDAHSADRYGPQEWLACAFFLLQSGFTMIEAEAILRSKWTRWAGDGSETPDRPSAWDLSVFVQQVKGKADYSVAELVAETFDD